jgi:EVE domain
MNTWIFQAVPDRNDLRDPALMREGEKDTWYATRYRDYMQPGDLVFFWLGGHEEIRGVYGSGRIISLPYEKPDWDSYGVDVRYEKRIDPHLSVTSIRREPVLADLLILRAPQATNFLLEPAQAKAIEGLISATNQRPVAV